MAGMSTADSQMADMPMADKALGRYGDGIIPT
jgi:hypothetical protein